MKKRTVGLLAFTLTLVCLFSACGTKQTNPQNESPKNQMEENRFINNEPRYGYGEGSDACIEPEYKINCRSMNEYLEAKSNSGFSVEEGWIPWEQFSVLGDFKKSYWIKGGSGGAQYDYLYTDPNTGKTMVYHVEFGKLPEKAAIVNMKEYHQWYYGKEISEDFFERSTVRYTAKDFSNPDLTKDQEVKKGVFILLDDMVEYKQMHDGQLDSFIDFVYNGYHILVVKLDESEEDYLPFDSSEDHEIIRRLTNTETYMDAIKELMDPKNAQTAK